MVIPFTTVLAFASLYLPQPILPLLAREFGVSQTDAALLTAVAMVPLGVAPIVYGFVVDQMSAKRLLRISVGLLMATELLLACATSFWMLLLLRFLQGLALPAVFTALMTYSAKSAAPERVRHALNVYIGTSIIGGVSGRLVGGFIAEFFHWRLAFVLIAALLACAWLGLAGLRADTRHAADQIGISSVRSTLADPVYRYAYLGIFFVFFVFASVLNYLPFRLTALRPDIMESTIALVYLGYLIGVAIALNGARIADRLGGELRGVHIGVALLGAGVVGMSTSSLAGIFTFVFCMCAGFFLSHSLLTAYLNHHTSGRKGIVNGLYIASYYAGGALGGWLPGYVYRGAGWQAFLASLLVMLGCAAWWIRRMRLASVRRAPA
jgi:YNFM family putative membrane transporter